MVILFCLRVWTSRSPPCPTLKTLGVLRIIIFSPVLIFNFDRIPFLSVIKSSFSFKTETPQGWEKSGLIFSIYIFENVGLDGATMGQYLDILPNYLDKNKTYTNENVNVNDIFQDYKQEKLIL